MPSMLNHVVEMPSGNGSGLITSCLVKRTCGLPQQEGFLVDVQAIDIVVTGLDQFLRERALPAGTSRMRPLGLPRNRSAPPGSGSRCHHLEVDPVFLRLISALCGRSRA